MPAELTVYQAIQDLLRASGADFRTLRHEPASTSEESARARGEELRVGGKALLIKAGEEFRLFVLSANLKVDSAAIKSRLNVKKTRFATAEELMQLTGLVPGSVPPFGRPILPFELYADPSVEGNSRIAFNAGSLTDSIVMPVEDWLGVAAPVVFRFAAYLP